MGRGAPLWLALTMIGCQLDPWNPSGDAESPSDDASTGLDQPYADIPQRPIEWHPEDAPPAGPRLILPVPLTGSLAVITPDSPETTFHEVGGQPHAVVDLGARVAFTDRDARSVRFLGFDGDGQVFDLHEVEVGPDPLDLRVSADGDHLWVAVGQADVVLELDADTGEIEREWRVPGQPRWIDEGPDGVLFVGSSRGGSIHQIDLSTDEVQAIPLPVRHRVADVQFSIRVTGRPTWNDELQQLLVPTLYVDNFSRVGQTDPNTRTSNSGYASRNEDPRRITTPGRIQPALTVIPRSSSGGTARVDSAAATTRIFAASKDGVLLRSFFADVLPVPGSPLSLLTLEGSAVVFVVDPNRASSDVLSDGFIQVPAGVVTTAWGPRDLHWMAGEAWVHGRESHTAGAIDVRRIIGDARKSSTLTFIEPWIDGRVVGPTEDDHLVGRFLFHSATDKRVTVPGGGVSCSTCHFDGATDGLTWNLQAGPRQTPSLRGLKSVTAPVTWTGNVASVAHEAQLTASIRMGGTGLSAEDATRLQGYIDSTPYPDAEPLDADPGAIKRGEDVFRKVGNCAACHRGDEFTDNKSWPMFGLESVNTPTLRGIGATAPYLHDGRAATLADVLQMAEAGGMGKTDTMTWEQKADLIAYLKSL